MNGKNGALDPSIPVVGYQILIRFNDAGECEFVCQCDKDNTVYPARSNNIGLLLKHLREMILKKEAQLQQAKENPVIESGIQPCENRIILP